MWFAVSWSSLWVLCVKRNQNMEKNAQTHQLIQSRVDEPHERKRPSWWFSPVSSGVSDAHWSSSFWWLDVCVLVFPQLVVVGVMTGCYFIPTCSCLLMTNPHKHISLHADATLLTPTRQCWRHVIIKRWRHPQTAIQLHTSPPTPRRSFV